MKRFALAHDYETAKGVSLTSYFEVAKHTLKIVRGSEGDADKPVTVAEAVDPYRIDLEARS